MINGPSVYDLSALGKVRPSPSVYEIDNKKDIHSVRRSNFCTEILIKLRPLAIARTSLIYAFLVPNSSQ